jgi:hypothetical protein
MHFHLLKSNAYTEVPPDTTSLSLAPTITKLHRGQLSRIPISSLDFLQDSAVTEVGRYCFAGCRQLRSLHGIPAALSYFAPFSFANIGITSLQGLPSTVTEITTGVFSHCSALASLDGLPSTVTEIGHFAFKDCKALVSVGRGIPPSTRVHRDAFKGCRALVNIAKEKGFDTVEEYAKALYTHRDVRITVIICIQIARRQLGLLAQLEQLEQCFEDEDSTSTTTTTTTDIHVVTKHNGCKYSRRLHLEMSSRCNGMSSLVRFLSILPGGLENDKCTEGQIVRNIVEFLDGAAFGKRTGCCNATRNVRRMPEIGFGEERGVGYDEHYYADSFLGD